MRQALILPYQLLLIFKINFMKQSIFILFLFFACMIFCKKNLQISDEIAPNNLTENISIKSVLSVHQFGSYEQINQDYVIKGVVISNDKENNFYKSIVIQDETAGVSISVDASNLNNEYPVGTVLYIKLNGLWIGDYGRLIQIGASVDTVRKLLIAIPQPLFAKYFYKTDSIIIPQPIVVTWEQLNDSLQSRLIQINQVEFLATDTSKTFADYWNELSASRNLRFCKGGNIYVRTSGYANFASEKIPAGNGTIQGIYSVYKTDKQLILRDLNDLQFFNNRCFTSTGDVLLIEDFENNILNSVFSGDNWQNISIIGNRKFIVQSSENNKYITIDAFAALSYVETWLVSPSFLIPEDKKTVLNFKTKDGFFTGVGLQVYISNNFSTSISKASWKLLDAQISTGSILGFPNNFVNSSNVSLNSYKGVANIAFKYTGYDTSSNAMNKTTTYLIDDIIVYSQ